MQNYFFLQEFLQVLHYFQLFLYYRVERATLYSKKSVPDQFFALPPDDRFEAHPERNTRDDLQNDAAETPHIDDPRVVVLLDVFEEFGDVFELIFVQDKVEDFRGHVLRSGHGELAEVAELEGTAVVDEFDFFEDGVGESAS
jgi:hypothetical protein